MNPLRQGFAWWCFANRGIDAESLLAGAARLGYSGVDLIDEPFWPVARQRGLRITAINGHSMDLGLNRQESAGNLVEQVRLNLQKAEAWQIPLLICFTGNRSGLDDDTGLSICAESLSKLAPMAVDSGVTLAVELFNSKIDHPDYQGDHVSFGVRLCQMVGSPAVRVLYDIYHMQIMDGDIIRTIRDQHQWFCHYHTAGNPGRGQPGADQELNYPAIYRAISATGYQGFVSHEFFPAGDSLKALELAYQDGVVATGRG